MYIILKNLVDRHDQLTDVFLFTTIDLKIKCLVITIWNRNVIQIVFIEKKMYYLVSKKK